MRVLLDESVPQKLRLLIDGHTVVSTVYRGWSGLKNGALLDAAEESGFDLFITADKELEHQQNLTRRKIAIIVLSTNNWSIVRAGVARIVAAIDTAHPSSYRELQLP
ncbi:MAG TPA: hypothetical protein VMG40_18100 [Bryobacteraceae bacterium]|nr:hypothetical protein [Bryobacteraceae bacterium]